MSDFQSKLLWSPLGVEVTVNSPEEEAEKVAEGYTEVQRAPPEFAPTVPAEFFAQITDAQTVEKIAEGPVFDAHPEVPPPDPENAPATFGPPDDDTFGDEGKSKKVGKKK